MAHALPRDVHLFVETTSGTPPASWPASGQPIKVIEPEAVLGKAQDPNENITQRRLGVLDDIPGLKSGDSSIDTAIYFTAAGVNAADQATAVATTESDILQAGLGGRVLGKRAQLDGIGTVSIPQVAVDPGYVNGQWVFAFDDSEGTGSFHRLEDTSGTPALAVTPDLPAGPDAADAFFATIMVFPQELNHDHTAAGYKTLSYLFQGEHPDDVLEMSGCKPTVGIEGLTAGEKLKFTLAHMVQTWPDVQPVKQVIAGAPSGIAPITVGSGVQTTIKIADVGQPLMNVDCRGSTDIDPGITWAPVSGACGLEGVKGWVSDITAATITIRIAFDDPTQAAKYAAGTKQQVLIQVGNQTTNAVGIYFPSLEFTARPLRINEGNTTTTEVSFRAHEDPAGVVSVLTGDDLALRLASYVLLFAA